jgi:transcription termination/antitermination protein NusA
MKISQEALSYITLFENISRAKIKDCLAEGENLIFIVEEGNVKKALGPNNKNLHKIERMTKKQVKIYGFSSEPVKFIKNLLYPIRVDEVEIVGKILKIIASDSRAKGKIFGRERENLKRLTQIVKKYFDIEEIKVL